MTSTTDEALPVFRRNLPHLLFEQPVCILRLALLGCQFGRMRWAHPEDKDLGEATAAGQLDVIAHGFTVLPWDNLSATALTRIAQSLAWSLAF